MNDEEIRNIIKIQLQHLSKEQLIDALTDIYMASPAFKIANALSDLKCTNIKDAIGGVQQVNASFNPLQRIADKEVNHDSVQTQTLSIKGDNDAVIYIDFCDGDLCASVVVEGKQADFHFEPTTLKMFAYAYKLHCEDMLNNSLKGE